MEANIMKNTKNTPHSPELKKYVAPEVEAIDSINVTKNGGGTTNDGGTSESAS